jgi:hypothetical protein
MVCQPVMPKARRTTPLQKRTWAQVSRRQWAINEIFPMNAANISNIRRINSPLRYPGPGNPRGGLVNILAGLKRKTSFLARFLVQGIL